MQAILVTIPDNLIEDFINHLGRFPPDKAKHITIQVLDDISPYEEVRIMSPELVAMQNKALRDSKLGLTVDFPEGDTDPEQPIYGFTIADKRYIESGLYD